MTETSPLLVASACTLVLSLHGVGCGADELEPGALLPPTGTDGVGPPPLSGDGADDTAGDGAAQRVCSVYDGDDALVHRADLVR